MQVVQVDDQPISATFFSEGRWLTDFITPDTLEIKKLYQDITKGISDQGERLAALRSWVANKIRYVPFVKGKLWIEGRSSVQTDLWNSPAITALVKVGNCANMSFLLTSLVRNELSAGEVSCVLGNLYNGKPGGHAWVQCHLNGTDFIMESTRPDSPTMVKALIADRYEPVHFFNDQKVETIEGRTVMTPFSRCYSEWLTDYLDWAYIEGG